jgi:hypothetical protein
MMILEHLKINYRAALVALEGGEGPLETSFLRAFPDEAAKEAVSLHYLRQGELTGAEASAILGKVPAVYAGIELAARYAANRDAFLRSLEERKRFEKNLKAVDTVMASLKQQLYPRKLRMFDLEVANYRNGRIPLREFLEGLKRRSEKAKIDLEAYPEIRHLYETLDVEKKMEEGALDELSEKFLWETMPRVEAALTDAEQVELSWHREAYEGGVYKKYVFVNYLWRKARELGVSLDAYRELETTLSVMGDRPAGRPEEPEREINMLVAEVKRSMMKRESEKELVTLERRLELVKKIGRLEADRGEYLEYATHKNEYSPEFFEQWIRRHYPTASFRWDLAWPEKFYELALERDRLLFRNLWKFMTRERSAVNVVVAGTFHLEALARRLKARGCSYLVLFPRMSTGGAEESYQRAMRGDVSYRFAGEQAAALEPPVALLDPVLKKDFLPAISERMMRHALEARGRASHAEAMKLLGEWARRSGPKPHPELARLERVFRSEPS